MPIQQFPIVHSPASGNHHSTFCLWIWPLWVPHVSGVIQCLSCCVLFISLRITFSRFICFVACVRIFLHFIYLLMFKHSFFFFFFFFGHSGARDRTCATATTQAIAVTMNSLSFKGKNNNPLFIWHFVYPLIWWWILRFPFFGYCDLCSYEHGCTNICSKPYFQLFWVFVRKWNCCIIW